MMLKWLIASIHLLALPIGLGAVWMRGLALRNIDGPDGLRRVFTADNLWGLAALLWIATGLLRAFAGFGKGTDYYLHNWIFHLKMGLLLAVLLLEIRPMIKLIRWRANVRRGQPVDAASAPALSRISRIQAGVVVLMVFAATALAGGYLY